MLYRRLLYCFFCLKIFKNRAYYSFFVFMIHFDCIMTESVFKNVKRIYSICRFLSFLACSMSFMPLSAQQASYLVTKSSSSVQSLCWSQDDSLYAVGADNEVFVMKADGNSAECSVPVPAASFLGFAKESVSDSLLLLALSEQGALSAWNVNGAVPLPAVSVHRS